MHHKEQKGESVQSALKDKIELSTYRWAMLALYFLSVLVNGVPYEICVPITSQVAKIYNTSSAAVTSASTIFMGMHPVLSFVAAQMIAKQGWAIATNLGVLLTILGCAIKLFVNQTGFWIILLGQFLCGMGRPFIFNSQASMAMSWFHPKTRIIIITLLNVVNTLSFVVSAQIPGRVFKGYNIEEDDANYEEGRHLMNKVCLLEFYISLLIVPCFFLLRSKPQNTEIKTQKIERQQGMLRAMLRLLKNKNFVLLFIPFSVYFGILKAILVIMELLMAPYSYSVTDVSGVVSTPLIGGLIAQGLCPYFVNKYGIQKNFIRIQLFLSALTLTVLFLALKSEHVSLVYLDITLLAVFVMPTLPVIMDISCDMISPIDPSFAVGALYLGSTVFFVAFTYILTFLAGDHGSEIRVLITNQTCTILLFLSFVCSLLVRFGDYAPLVQQTLIDPEDYSQENIHSQSKVSKFSQMQKTSSFFNCSVNNIGLIGDAPIIANEVPKYDIDENPDQ